MTDFTPGRGDRDELAEAISDRSEYEGFPPADEIADALWSAGWRKKPSREDVARAMWNLPVNVIDWEELRNLAALNDAEYKEARDYVLEQADAILALLDGPTETGEK